MTYEEFAAWTQITNSSATKWRMDEITLANRGELLVYKGGRDGIWIRVGRDGDTSGGFYEGAVPHIGEACFTRRHERRFASQDEAVASLCERFGAAFLRTGILDL